MTTATTMYYAVTNVNGPISCRIDADNLDAALAAFGKIDAQAAIDSASADAEDDFGIDGTDMSELEFDEALRCAGCSEVSDLSEVHNAHTNTTRHISGGWYLWRHDVEVDAE